MSTKKFCPYCMTPMREGEPCPGCGLTEGSYSPAPHHLPPGTVLMERYLIGRVLGEGGFGITYIGCDLRLEMKVAVKEYFPTERVTRNSGLSLEVTSFSGISEEAYRHSKAKFLREARAMARMVKQPEIVGVRDYFEANSTAYIVMEYIEGTTLKALVEQRGGRIPAGELLHLMEPIFGALSVMHDSGLIHRDISPENMMMENGSIRLLDFGCARDDAAGIETLTISLKYGYAPVEQYQSKGQGPWTDVYALAATIYFCLTGKRPPQAMDRLVEDELILPRKLGVDLTEKQESALLYGMGIHPRRRFRSMQEFHAALYEGVDWKTKTEAGNPRTGNFGSDTADSENTESKSAVLENADFYNTDSGREESEETENRPEEDSFKPESTVQTPEKSAWRTWLAGHRIMVLAGAAAAAALILIGVSAGVATSRQSGQTPSAQTGSDSIAANTESTTVQEIAKADSTQDTETTAAQDTESVTEASAEQDTETVTEASAELNTESVTEASTEQDTEPVTEASDEQTIETTEESSDTQDTGAVSASAYMVDTETAAARRSELEALFVNAQTFTGDNGNWEGIMTMLEDDSVSAIIIPSGTGVTTFAEVTITKPVLVEENAFLGAFNTMTLDGENACVYVKGEFSPIGVVRTVNGGRIVMDGEDCLFDSYGAVWLESNADLEILGGNLMVAGDQLLVLSLADTFAGSREVSTAEEFKAVLNDGSVDSVTVTGDITVDAEGEDTLYISIPVCVNEGASLSVTGAVHELGSGEEIYLDSEAILVNYGTLNAYLNCGSSLIYNTGSWNGGIFAFCESDSSLLLLNQGDMTLGDDDSYGTIDGNAGFFNEGTLTVQNGIHLNLAGNLFCNRGTITVTGDTTTLRITEGIIARNLGEIHVESGTFLRNDTLLENRGGSILVEGGQFANDGVFWLAGGLLNQQSGSVVNDGLLLVSSDDGNLELTEDPGGTVETLPADDTDGRVIVTSGEDLQTAMNDDSVQGIIIEDSASIDGDFTVTKPVIGGLYVSGTLTVSGGFLAQYNYSAPICAENIVLENGSFVFQQADLTANSLTVSGGAAWYRGGSWYSECENPWGNTYLKTTLGRLVIEDGGQVCNLSSLTLNGTEVEIQTGGELLSRGPLQLDACNVNIASDGYLLLGGGYRIGEDTTVVNDGWLESGYINDFKEGLMAGVITNNGAMYMKMQLTGVVENNGHFYQDEGERNFEVQDGGELRGNASEIFSEEESSWRPESD